MPAWQARSAPLVLGIPAHTTELPGILVQRMVKDNVTAYLYSGHAWDAPLTEFARLDVVLAATESPR